MELIYYREAAELLGISPGSLRHAVAGDRKVLTVLHQGQKCQVVKEQVMLFKGKRLSMAALSLQERQIWQEYANEALKPHAAVVNEETINRMIEQKVKAQFLQQEAARLKREEDRAREKRERFEEEYRPFLMAV